MKFLKSEKATVLVELGVAIPVLMVLIFSGLEIARYMLAHQKVSRLATSIADISSQGQAISEAEISNLFLATEFIAGNLDFDTKGHMKLTAVSVDTNNLAIVDWQRQFGADFGAKSDSRIGAPGGGAALPANLALTPGEGVIIAEVFYDYEALLFGELISNDLVYKRAYYRPRFGALQEVLP